MLSLLQSILVPALRYGCQIWGMHTPTGEAKAARASLQSVYDRFLKRICGVKHAPSAVLLKNWLCHLYKYLGGSRLWSCGTLLLLGLLGPFSAAFYLTTSM